MVGGMPTDYRITVRGRLSERLASAFDPFSLEHASGRTVLVGAVEDQAHLYGILDRIRDFGLELLRVEELDR